MIIKIDVDDGINSFAAIDLAKLLINSKDAKMNLSIRSSFQPLSAKITQISRAGNIFIHVSKTEK